jgi:acetoin utilization deacetylase AcuC-like enzyme
MSDTAFIYSSDFSKHDTGPFHPEAPERAQFVYDYIRSGDLAGKLRFVEPKPAEPDWIHAVHSEDYAAMVASACKGGARDLDGGDTRVCAQSYEVALLSAGSVVVAVDEVLSGRCRSAFSCARPPGHHASASRAMGFCLFNNIAIGARYAQQRYGAERILIVDWDVHHGNGTEEIFAHDASVLFFSTHMYPFYPGTGAENYTGEGAGLGYTLNAPMIPGADIAMYRRAFHDLLLPAAKQFSPDLVMVSAGFDAHNEDPLASICLQDEDFSELTDIVMGIAAKTCRGRLVSILEGGYNLQALARSVYRHLACLTR